MTARRTRNDKKCACGEKQGPRKAVLAITNDSEAHRLWRHALIGTGTCISLIEQYIEVGMPHPPVDQLLYLRDRLNKVIP
jgi:hypothetical protein